MAVCPRAVAKRAKSLTLEGRGSPLTSQREQRVQIDLGASPRYK